MPTSESNSRPRQSNRKPPHNSHQSYNVQHASSQHPRKNVESSPLSEEKKAYKSKHLTQLSALKEMFSDWTMEELIDHLQMADGDESLVATRIAAGHASQFETVSNKKLKDKPKKPEPLPQAAQSGTPVPRAQGGGRGSLERGGRKRGGSSRGIRRGTSRGSRDETNAKTTNNTEKGAENSGSLNEEGTGANFTLDHESKTDIREKIDILNGQRNVAGDDSSPIDSKPSPGWSESAIKPLPSVRDTSVERPTRKVQAGFSWASVAAPPKPKPVQKLGPGATSPSSISTHRIEPHKEHFVTSDANLRPAPLTKDNLEAVTSGSQVVEPVAPATTVASNIGSSASQSQKDLVPPGFSKPQTRRYLEPAIAMPAPSAPIPSPTSADRSNIQFGSLNLAGREDHIISSDAQKEALKTPSQPPAPMPQTHQPSPAAPKMQQPHQDQKVPQPIQQQPQQQAYRYPHSHLQAKPEQHYEPFSHSAQYHQGMPFSQQQHYIASFGDPSYYDQRSMGYMIPDAYGQNGVQNLGRATAGTEQPTTSKFAHDTTTGLPTVSPNPVAHGQLAHPTAPQGPYYNPYPYYSQIPYPYGYGSSGRGLYSQGTYGSPHDGPTGYPNQYTNQPRSNSTDFTRHQNPTQPHAGVQDFMGGGARQQQQAPDDAFAPSFEKRNQQQGYNPNMHYGNTFATQYPQPQYGSTTSTQQSGSSKPVQNSQSWGGYGSYT